MRLDELSQNSLCHWKWSPLPWLRYVLPASPELGSLHAVLVLLQLLLWVSYFLCRTVSPGLVPTHDPEYQQTMDKIIKFDFKFEGGWLYLNALRLRLSKHAAVTVSRFTRFNGSREL